jgi:alkylresorcinol/alkylpyrone synthase
MPYIVGLHTGLPEHYYDQETLISALLERWGQRYHNPQRIADFQRHVLVGGRHLAQPLEAYPEQDGFGAQNDAWLAAALPLAEQVVGGVLADAGLAADQLDLMISTTVTGIAVPSLDARLMNRLPLRPDLKRMPLFGLGCLAGVAGLNRAGDYLLGHPREAAVLLSVELCSLTLQKEDLSIANIIASGLFGDGAAAVLMVGDEHPLAVGAPLRWSSPKACFFPDTERVMGWDVVDSGFRVVLAPAVADIVAAELPGALDALCESEGFGRSELAFYVAHPGGPKVLTAAAAALGLDDSAFAASWDSLRRHGNMSSTSVLFVLAELLSSGRLEPGARGAMFAMGPAFCAELALLEATGQ